MSTPVASHLGGAYRATPAPTTAPVNAPNIRGPLSRAKIITAAVEVIDAGGVDGLTMRSVSGRLGVEAMALYRYVQSRDDLLDGVADHLIDDLDDDPDLKTAAPTWQAYLVRLAHAVRRTVLAHPRVFPLIATRPTAAPWIRPPLRTLRWVDAFIRTLLRHQFSDAAAVTAYRAFNSFLLGELLPEIPYRTQTIPIIRNATDPTSQISPDNPSSSGCYPSYNRTTPRKSSTPPSQHSSTDSTAAPETHPDRRNEVQTRPDQTRIEVRTRNVTPVRNRSAEPLRSRGSHSNP